MHTAGTVTQAISEARLMYLSQAVSREQLHPIHTPRTEADVCEIADEAVGPVSLRASDKGRRGRRVW